MENCLRLIKLRELKDINQLYSKQNPNLNSRTSTATKKANYLKNTHVEKHQYKRILNRVKIVHQLETVLNMLTLAIQFCRK